MPKLLNVGNLSNPTVYQTTLENFKGVDLSSGETACAAYRSPDAPNMMPDRDGFPVKRPGYRTLAHLPHGAVYGAHSLVLPKLGERYDLVHSGTSMAIVEETPIFYENIMAEAPSWSCQMKDRLWTVDGQTFRCFAKKQAETGLPIEAYKVSDIATVPMITISKAPNGVDGATSYRPVNLLTGKKIDSYLGTETDKDYYTSFQGLLESSTVEVQILDKSGYWAIDTTGSIQLEQESGSVTLQWTVDRELGKISFSQPPGKSPVTGEDNVRIRYETASQADIINKMRFGIVYGVGGAMDRLFLAGNPDEPTVDRWSEWNDPTYFPDTNYAELGQDGAPIVGYSVLGDALVTHKKRETEGRNAFVRTGELDEDGNAVFRIVNVIQGEGALAEKSFQSFGGEPVFLTREGVYALTPSDLTGDRYTQLRSYYLNGGLLREPGLEAACSCVWGRFYVLAVNGKLYLLDNEQKSYESRSPNSSYQYEGYVFEDIWATTLWTDKDGRLCFGTVGGKVCRMDDPLEGSTGTDYTENTDTEGVPVKARWTTPLMELESWSNTKSIKNVWIVAMPYARSGGEIYYSTDKKTMEKVREYTMDIFAFAKVQFSRFTFNAISRGLIYPTRRKAKKAKVFQLIVKNEKKEAFGLLGITLQYTKGGKIKK